MVDTVHVLILVTHTFPSHPYHPSHSIPPSPILQQQNTTASQSSVNSTLNQLAQNVEAINSTGIAAQVERILDTRLSGVGLPESFPANLTAVDTHYNCTTTLEENCNIPISLGSLTGSSPCATEDIPMNREVSVPVLKYAH